ncbi:MAG: lanthionine synthetase LanC family protein [Gemmatimonadales bacterium]
MTPPTRFVLAPALELRPVSEIDPETRRRLGCREGDYLLSRPTARSNSKILERELGFAVAQLSVPVPLAEAIYATSEHFATKPEATLDALLPGLNRLLAEGFIVPADSVAALGNRTLAAGAVVGGWEVGACLHQMDDSHVYQVRRPGARFAALKIAVTDEPSIAAALQNEARILGRLRGAVVPQLWAEGHHDGRPFLVLEWRPGTSVTGIAAEHRSLPPARRDHALLDLCVAVATGYAWLHRNGVVHGDVHDGNLLVAASRAISILDFGIGRDLRDRRANPPRGAAGYFYEPEYAAAGRTGRNGPPATVRGEQYLVAALLFELVTGMPYLDFGFRSAEVMEQIVQERPRTFEGVGRDRWPRLEAVLGRALAKEPAARYPSTAMFARALATCRPPMARSQHPAGEVVPRRPQYGSRDLIARLARLDGAHGPRIGRPPTASVGYGAAGVAYALLRASQQTNDAGLLSAADVWAEEAVQAARRDGGRAFGGPELPNDEAGPISLLFSKPGLHCVRALVARARADEAAVHRSVGALERSAASGRNPFDLALGQAGLLLACAIILEQVHGWPDVAARVARLGNRIGARIGRGLARLGRVGSSATLWSLGMAHGWAGALYAALRWQGVGGQAMKRVEDRLDELARLGESHGRGVRFPWRAEGDRPDAAPRYMPGWCNGSAGFVHLWLAAGRATGRSEFLALAEGCAWDAWEGDDVENASLCCGFCGRSYALLAWYRHSSDDAWLRRAVDLARRGQNLIPRRRPDPSLYKGDLATALLLRELARPELARMPLFESEGWPVPNGSPRAARGRQ